MIIKITYRLSFILNLTIDVIWNNNFLEYLYNQNYIEKNSKWIRNNDIIQYLTIIYIIIYGKYLYKKYMNDIYIKTSRDNNNKIRS